MKETITDMGSGKTYNMEDAPIESLKAMYESICNEYRRRLCEMWEIPYEESWWCADRVGEGLFLCDCNIPLDMPMLRYVVENNVPESDWIAWCDFVDSEIFAGREIPRINFFHWMMGARPEVLKDENMPTPTTLNASKVEQVQISFTNPWKRKNQ